LRAYGLPRCSTEEAAILVRSGKPAVVKDIEASHMIAGSRHTPPVQFTQNSALFALVMGAVHRYDLCDSVFRGNSMEQWKALRSPEEMIRRAQLKAVIAQPGRDEVTGFAIVGQPFASGDLLCLRRFPASTFGPGYVSVWHRAPSGQWTIYTSVAAELSCPRFVGAAASRVVDETPITVNWTGPSDISVQVPSANLQWSTRVTSTLVTRLMNIMMSAMPAVLFRNNAVLSIMSLMSTAMLSAGRFRLRGHMPNRQWFQAGPRLVWVVAEAHATIEGRDLGPAAPLAAQVMLGEVPLPQRGILMSGTFSFEEYTSGRHLSPRAFVA